MAKVDKGRDLLRALVVTQDGKELTGEPVKGKCVIAMKANMKYHGIPKAALKELKKSFPDCTFAWAKDKPVK
jgi:hypothetical protein